MKLKTVLVLSLLVFELSYTQSGHGFSFDNYNSLYALTINPAFSVESKTKWHINGFSYNHINFTDVGEIDPFDFNYLSTPNGFDGIDYSSNFRVGETQNNMHTERDWLLPSVIYKFNEKISAGLILRSRALVNYSNFNGSLFELINPNENEPATSTSENYPETSFNFTNTAHYWNEVGLNFAISVINKDKHVVKIGGTVKWLQGQGAINVKGANVQSSLNTLEQLTISTDSITYLNTFKNGENIESNVVAGPFQNFFNSTSTLSDFGGDVGLIWEIRPNSTNRLERGLSESAVNLYKAKISASVSDLGQITYEDDPNLSDRRVLNDTYRLSGFTVPISRFQQNNLVEVLEEDAPSDQREQPRGEVKVALPTALNVNVDYLIKNDKNYYVNVNYQHPIRKNTDRFSNQRMQLLTVTPRYETPDWSVYVPVSIGLETDWAVGLGVRYKYATAGISIPELGGINYVYVGFNAPLIKL